MRNSDLKSINWQHGMLLSPDHFVQQERYFEEYMQWLARYCVSTSGLVGNGVRVTSDLAPNADPVIDVRQDDREIRIVVTQLRAISEQGQMFEVTPDNPAKGVFSLDDVSGEQADIYVLAEPGEKLVSGEPDEANPDMSPYRVQQYKAALNLDEGSLKNRVLVGRLVRPGRRERFELSGEFIPPCATVSAHSQMKRMWHGTVEELKSIAEHYIDIHRSIVEYLALAQGRNLDLTEDRETLEFVSRVVVTLEHCIYETLDGTIAPSRFLQEVYRVVRSSAVFLDLSPPTRSYFKQLASAGETEFLPMLDQQLGTLRIDRQWMVQQDLATEIGRLNEGIHRLRRLGEALGGKYLDYRLSPSLEALGFVFDRDDGTLFKAVGKAQPQSLNNETTFVFALRGHIEGRERYRVILIGDARSTFRIGEVLRAGVSVRGGGVTLQPFYPPPATCTISGQHNFALDFEVQDISAVSDVRVTIPRSEHVIRGAVLYVKRMLFGMESQLPASQSSAQPTPRPPADPARWPAQAQAEDPKPPVARAKYLNVPPKPKPGR